MKTFTFMQFLAVIVENMCQAIGTCIRRKDDGRYEVQFNGHPTFPYREGDTIPMAITRDTEDEIHKELRYQFAQIQTIFYSRNGSTLYEAICKAAKRVVMFAYDGDPVDANVAQFGRYAAFCALAEILMGKKRSEIKHKDMKANGKSITVVVRVDGSVEICTGGPGNLRCISKGQAKDLTPYDDSDPEIQSKYRAHIFKRGTDSIRRIVTKHGQIKETPEVELEVAKRAGVLAIECGVSKEDMEAHWNVATVH